jgi:hypothetical protein
LVTNLQKGDEKEADEGEEHGAEIDTFEREGYVSAALRCLGYGAVYSGCDR